MAQRVLRWIWALSAKSSSSPADRTASAGRCRRNWVAARLQGCCRGARRGGACRDGRRHRRGRRRGCRGLRRPDRSHGTFPAMIAACRGGVRQPRYRHLVAGRAAAGAVRRVRRRGVRRSLCQHRHRLRPLRPGRRAGDEGAKPLGPHRHYRFGPWPAAGAARRARLRLCARQYAASRRAGAQPLARRRARAARHHRQPPSRRASSTPARSTTISSRSAPRRST